ncbi:MAG: hypothetical protein RSD95_16665, partial [Clostridia bacterium]
MKSFTRIMCAVLGVMMLCVGGVAQSEMPITTQPLSLSAFCVLDGKAAVSLSSLDENLTMKHYEALSGIDIEWFHPSSASNISESVNLMLASGDLPDILFYITSASESIDSLINNGLILDLKDLIYENCPNLVALISQHPEILSQITTQEGHIGVLPALRLAESTRYFESFILREDWLKKLDLSAPTTTEEWYNVLSAFKNKDPNGNGIADELAFVGNTTEDMSVSRLASLWGFNACFYKQYATGIQDGKVTFAIDSPAFDTWVKEMAKWYAEGLIDMEYLSCDATTWKEKVLTDKAGA